MKLVLLSQVLKQGENLDHVDHTQDIYPILKLSDISH